MFKNTFRNGTYVTKKIGLTSGLKDSLFQKKNVIRITHKKLDKHNLNEWYIRPRKNTVKPVKCRRLH